MAPIYRQAMRAGGSDSEQLGRRYAGLPRLFLDMNMIATLKFKVSIRKQVLRKSVARRTKAVAQAMHDLAVENIIEGVDGDGHAFAPIWQREDYSVDNILHPTGTHLLAGLEPKSKGAVASLVSKMRGSRLLHEGGYGGGDHKAMTAPKKGVSYPDGVERQFSGGYYPPRRFGIPGRNWAKILEAFRKG